MPKGRSLSSPTVLLLVLIVLRLIFGWAGSRAPLQLLPGDVGQWLDSGDRLLRGELPYRDYLGFYGPLLYLGSGVLYGLLGANWFAAFLQFEVVSPVLSLLLAYAVAMRMLRRDWARLLFIGVSFLVGLDHWPGCFCVRVWGPLACLAFSEEAFRLREPRRLAWAGLAAGGWLFVSVETAAAGLMAIALLALLETWRSKRDRARLRAAFSAVLAVPAGAMLFFPGPTIEYLKTMIGLARYQNWFGGLPFPAASWLSLGGWVLYAPFVLAAAGAAWHVSRLAAARSASEKLEASGGLALAVFSVVLLRSALGRTDDMHLVFSMAPVVLLWLRFCDRLEGFAAAPLVAAGLLSPFVAASAAGGELDYLSRVAGHSTTGLVEWREEGVLVHPQTIERMEAVSAAVRARVPPGRPFLSLPLAVAAHAARRPSASPFLFLDYLPAAAGGSRRLLESLERGNVACVLVDPRLALPRSDFDLPGAERPLTWFTDADESITRELRAYLDSRFEPDAVVDGAIFLKRRVQALPEARRSVVGAFEPPSNVEAGKEYAFDGPPVRFDELRVSIRCRYYWGLASLAKTRLAVSYVEAGGAIRRCSIPVPPAQWDPELRVPAEGAPVRRIELELVNPGAFNPKPTSVELGPIRLVAEASTKR